MILAQLLYAFAGLSAAQPLPSVSPDEPVGFLCGSKDGRLKKSDALILLSTDGISKDRPLHLIVRDPGNHLEGIPLTKGAWSDLQGRNLALLSNLGDAQQKPLVTVVLLADKSDPNFFSAIGSISRDFDGKSYRDVRKQTYLCKLITGDAVSKLVPILDKFMEDLPE